MKVQHRLDLTPCNSYRVRATADVAYFPESAEDLEEFFAEYDRADVEVLGHGNNIILSQPAYSRPFLILGRPFSNIEFGEEGVVEAAGGADMRDVSRQAGQRGLSGIEVFCDIPSSVGGAITMNASASGAGLGGALEQVLAFDTVVRRWCSFDYEGTRPGYRRSIFQDNGMIVASARFRLRPGDAGRIGAAMDEIRRTRHGKQPVEWANAGSVFKRPDGMFVGTMVEDLGLKGLRVGGASVSHKHAGFIINDGGATGRDIIELVEAIRERVLDAFGVTLELEQRVI